MTEENASLIDENDSKNNNFVISPDSSSASSHTPENSEEELVSYEKSEDPINTFKEDPDKSIAIQNDLEGATNVRYYYYDRFLNKIKIGVAILV